MERNSLTLGGIYKTDLNINPIRVIAFDNFTVFYDVWSSHKQDWQGSNYLNSSLFFYRTSTKRFTKMSEFVYKEPLSEKEWQIYKPDLPFYLCRNDEMRWGSENYPDIGLFKKGMSKYNIDFNSLGSLDTPKALLVPFGPNGGHKKSVAVEALNGKYFEGVELFWHAYNAQAVHIKGLHESGVGVYRLGFKKDCPSYYIGGFYDSANFLKDN